MHQNSNGAKMRFGKMMIYAGAVMSLLIGAAFATGQEVLMYFVAWGDEMFLVIGIILAVIIWVSLSFAAAGSRYHFDKNEEIFVFFCGKYVGKFYDYFTVVFSYACYLFMIGGVGSTMKEQFGIPGILGIVGLSVIAVLTVTLGLSKITDILGCLGSVLLVVIGLISIGNLLMHMDQVGPNFAAINTFGPEYFGMEKSIAPNAFMNALNYMGTVIIWFTTFITMMAVQSERKKEIKVGSVVGSVLFMAALLIVAFAMISVIELVGASEVPSVLMAGNLWKPLASAFAVIVIGGSYTTAVPLLWTPVSRFTEDGSRQSRILAVILGAAGIVITLFIPYRTLMNYIMNIGGLLVYVMYALILWTDIRMYQDYKKENRH